MSDEHSFIANLTQNRQKTQKDQKKKKTGFPIDSLEEADLYKPVLNNIITLHE